MKIKCAYCGKQTEKATGHYNRAMKFGVPLYCDIKCVGLSRRTNETKEEKKAIKSWYDMFLRVSMTEEERILDSINNALYFQMDYNANPEKYKAQRQKKMPKHVEYCRQPKYKEYKREYDSGYHAKKKYGEFGEAAVMLLKLEKEIDVRLAKAQNGIINKSQKRKRLWQKMQAKQTISSLLAI